MTANRTILIVDDEPETLRGYEEYLVPPAAPAPKRSSRQGGGPAESAAAPEMAPEDERYELALALSGEEAIAKARELAAAGTPVAAGFFDVKLGGGIDGIETVQEVRKTSPDLYCAVVTAFHDRTVEEINRIFGPEFRDHWDYLNKPFTQGEIVQKARQMVAAWNRNRELEDMRRELVRSEKHAAIGQVARGIGHEFGNILFRIMGKADMALNEKDPAKIRSHLEVIIRSSERAGVIVRNLQSFSKTDPRLVRGNLGAPAREALSLLEHELKRSSVKLAAEFLQGPEVMIDAGRMAQVFLNLFINAIHAMQGGGTLGVCVEAAQGSGGRRGAAARVSDTGTGIPPDVLPRIFEFAFSTKGDTGSGLGLSIAREIVESHGGTLTVATQIGKGTEFTIWLPEAAPA